MTTDALAEWRDLFLELNRCPWPGPRPLLDSEGRGVRSAEITERERVEARRQLRGRDLEISDLGMACISNHLVVLHGQSGVGKSSIINVGLVPELEALGKLVILRKDWGAMGAATPSQYLTQTAIEEERLTQDPFADGPEAVDRDFPNQLVFILDQFEELIRSEPGFAHATLRWISEVAGKTSAKFVISLRSEYEYQLRDLQTKPFTKRARIEIAPIKDRDTIRTIVGGDPEFDASDVMPIDRDAEDELVKLWEDAQSENVTTTWNRPGLLHLQAALYVLWMDRDIREGGPGGLGLVTRTDVDSLRGKWEARWGKRSGGAREDGDDSVLGYGLERSVQVAIQNCIDACDGDPGSGWAGVPDVVSNQARWIFRDVTEHLASGGYKTQQDMWDLAHKVLAYLDEPSLKQTPGWASRLYADDDWLGVQRDHYGLDGFPAAARSPFANGPAAPLTTDELVFELYRCYFFALEWMRHANIVQVLPSGSSYRVTLTHDRFSEGLASWRESQFPDFEEAVGRYVAHRGKSDLTWSTLEFGLSEGRLVVNTRWKQCVIGETEFRDVTFVNCDFAGSIFDGCTFDGAVFVNCVLDDVDFVGCIVKRAPEWRVSNEQWLALDPDVRRPLVEDPPTFTMPIDRTQAQDLAALLGDDKETSGLLESPPSGSGSVVAAVVVETTETDGTVGPAEVAPEVPLTRGGLVMCGGRLSSLTFRRCTFEDGLDDAGEYRAAKVVLRHIAGTSLEICEQTHGTFDVFAAAVRGLAVTLPVAGDDEPTLEKDAPEEDDSNRRPAFAFDLRHAKVINTWLGVRLAGRATFTDCNVWQLINASSEMKVDVTNSAFFGLINTGEVADPDSLPLGTEHFTVRGVSPEAVESILQVSRNIDVPEE